MREYILIYVTATIPQDTLEHHLLSLSALHSLRSARGVCLSIKAHH